MRIKKVITCILAVCTIMGSLSLQGIFPITGVAADNGLMRDSMTAQEFSDDMGLGINLGNTMEAYNASNCESLSYKWPPIVGSNKPQDYERVWGSPVTTQEMINGMKASGFNTVRIPVFWGNMMENDGKYKISDEYIARVKEIVDYCRNANLYTVINIHHFDEFIIRRNTKEKSAEIFTNLWTQIAEYFKDYSDYLVFEGYNEYLGGGPINPETDKIEDLPKSEAYDWTNTMNQAFVDAVRATGGNNLKRMLIASGYNTNIDNTTNEAFKMPNDSTEGRLMVSVHYVDHSVFGASQVGNQSWKEYSIRQLELLKKAFSDKGIPVFVGESITSTTYSEDKGIHFAENAKITDPSEAMDYMFRLIKGYGFIPVLWDNNDFFYSRTDCKIKLKADEKVIKTLSQELSNGTFIPPEIDNAAYISKDEALGVLYSGKIPITLASGKADTLMAGAVKIRYIFDCALDTSFNEWSGIELSAKVSGTEIKNTVKGNSYMPGLTSLEAVLDLVNQIKEGDNYSVLAYTSSWKDASDYVFLIRRIEFLDDKGNVIKTFQKTNRPDTPSVSSSDNSTGSSGSTNTTHTKAPSTNASKETRSAADVLKDKSIAQKAMKQAKITKLKAKSKAKKKITVTWKKVKKAKGYQVQISEKKKFKKIIFEKFTTKNKLTIKKKIKSKKIYYVRVRAFATYKDKNGKAQKVYSKWIKKTRKVKVK